MTPDRRPRLVQVGPTTWELAAWARDLCVNCDQPLAPGDTIACAEHRRLIDAEPMPWDAPTPARPGI